MSAHQLGEAHDALLPGRTRPDAHRAATDLSTSADWASCTRLRLSLSSVSLSLSVNCSISGGRGIAPHMRNKELALCQIICATATLNENSASCTRLCLVVCVGRRGSGRHGFDMLAERQRITTRREELFPGPEPGPQFYRSRQSTVWPSYPIGFGAGLALGSRARQRQTGLVRASVPSATMSPSRPPAPEATDTGRRFPLFRCFQQIYGSTSDPARFPDALASRFGTGPSFRRPAAIPILPEPAIFAISRAVGGV
jgi:hypothetical protein